MAAYMISHDLRKRRNYQELYDKLAQWRAVQLLESVWLARVRGDAGAVLSALRRVLDADDGIAVIEVQEGSDWSTYSVPDAAVDWLQKNVSP